MEDFRGSRQPDQVERPKIQIELSNRAKLKVLIIIG